VGEEAEVVSGVRKSHPKPTSAIGIVRVSQVNGRGADFASPHVQRDRIADLCRRENLHLLRTLDELDVGGSKKLSERKQLVAAIEDVERGRADVIVVAYFDRLVRSLSVQAELLKRVEDAGGRVLSADIGEVSHDTTAKWVNATMHGMLAEYHNRITAEKTAEAQVRAVANGIPPSKLPPGLRRAGDTLELTEDAPVVAEAVRMRAEGAPIMAVRAYLREHGIRRSYNGVKTLIGSRLLVGEIVFGKLRGTCPAIVDLDTWERAQSERSRGPQPKSGRLLARLGVLRCATCDARLSVGTQTQHGRTYPFYRCVAQSDCPRRVTISAEIAERVVATATRAMLEGTVGARAVRDHARDVRAAYRRAQDTLDAFIELLDPLEPAAKQRLAQVTQTRDRARAALAELGPAEDTTLLLLDRDWDQLTIDDQRRCIRAVIKDVRVVPSASGLRPQDRLEVTYHEGLDVLTGRTASLPSQLETPPQITYGEVSQTAPGAPRKEA
jgi:DNA invertase Pin-like site-specific DNA recombinase